MRTFPLMLIVFFSFTACQSLSDMKRSHCSITNYDLPGDGLTVKVTKYAGSEPSDRAILLLPPTGGTNLIDRSNAKKFCTAGFDVYILNSWTGDEEDAIDFELHHRFYDRSRRAVGAVLKDVKSPFVGMLGISVGATFAAVNANLYESIDAIFVVVGGAPMASIITNSDQKAMVDLKKKRLAKYGAKTDEEYQATIEKVFPLDPFKTPPLFKNKTLGMLISTIDTTVPARDQLALRDLWKPQTVYTLESSHFMSIVKSWWSYQKEITQFFTAAADKKLNKK